VNNGHEEAGTMKSQRSLCRIAATSVVFAIVMLMGPVGGEAQSPQEAEDRARQLFDQEQYLQAGEALQQILRRDPQHPMANVLLSFALARLGNAPAAIAQTRRALELLPANVNLQLLLAGLFAQNEQTLGESIALYQGILASDPDNEMARLGLAEAFRSQGRTLEAIQQFSRLTDKFPNDPRYWVRLGQLHGSLGDLAEARTKFDRAYALAPQNEDAVRALAVLNDVEDRPQEALRYYQELVTLFPGDSVAEFALRAAKERLVEPQFPVLLDQIEQMPLESYQRAAVGNSKQLQHRREQLDATRLRSQARFLPSFFFSPSFGHVYRSGPNDTTETYSFSLGWSLADLIADPYKTNITGMKADVESVTSSLLAEVANAYYQRLQVIVQYRQLQRQLALEPQNVQLRQSKQTVKYTLLNLTERIKLLTGIP
jgi:tetratricopeptide (TPR) repeat protein